MPRPPAITPGDEFGRLRAITMLTERRHGSVVWQCLCAPDLRGCGKTVNVSTGNLRSGSTRSCGCLADEARRIVGRTCKRARGEGSLGGKTNAEHMRSRYRRWVNAGRCGTCGRPPVPLHIQCAACIERKRRETND